MAKTQFQNYYNFCVYVCLSSNCWKPHSDWPLKQYCFFSFCVHRWLDNCRTERTTELQILSKLAAYSPNQSTGRGGATLEPANPEWGVGPWGFYKCCYWPVCWSLRLWVSLTLLLLFLCFQWLLRSILIQKQKI